MSRFLRSREEKKKTYPSLKNSAGCILGKKGREIHHLAQLSSIPIPGINTRICKTIKTTPKIMMFLFFWKNLSGTIYTHKAIMTATAMFFNCLRK